jgi:hypothetical protein
MNESLVPCRPVSWNRSSSSRQFDIVQMRSAGAASLVDKILGVANPGDLPIEQPTILQLIVNLRSVKAIGLTMSCADQGTKVSINT